MIRKHSIELRKDRDNNKDDIELPPLKLKRGFTTAFWFNNLFIVYIYS